MDGAKREDLVRELREARVDLQRLANQMTKTQGRLIDIIIRLLHEVELR